MRFPPMLQKLARWLVTSAALAYVVWTLMEHKMWQDDEVSQVFWNPPNPLLLWLFILGMPVNLGLETAKWHALTSADRKPWSRSMREVLTGMTFGLVTPNRTGDAVARVAMVPPSERTSGARAWAVGAWAQAGWTWTFGAISSAAVLTNAAMGNGEWAHGHRLPVAACAAVCVALVAAAIAWWRIPHWAASGDGGWSRRFTDRFEGLKTPLSASQMNRQVVFSGLRFLVFTAQFACALGAWGIEVDGSIWTAIALVYLGNMLVPTAALAELGVREALIVAWIQPEPDWTVPLVAATFAIWLVNLCIPALIGGGMQLTVRRHA